MNNNFKKNFLFNKKKKARKYFKNIKNNILNIFLKNKKYILYIIFIFFLLFPVYRIIHLLQTTVLDFFFLEDYNNILFDKRGSYRSNIINILFYITQYDLLYNPKSSILLSKIVSIDLEDKSVVSASLSPYFILNSKDLFVNTSINNYFHDKDNLKYKDIFSLNNFLSHNYFFNRYSHYFYISLNNYLKILNHLNIKCDFLQINQDYNKLNLEFNDDDIKSLDVCMNNLLNQLGNPSFILKLLLLNLPNDIFSDGTYTNFTASDLLNILFIYPGLKNPIKSKYFSVKDYSKVPSNDTLNIHYPNVIKIKQDIYGLFSKLDIIKEQARIEIFNSTSMSGLASRIKNIIDIYGGKVITFNNFPENFEETVIFINNKNNYSYRSTLKLIDFIFGKNFKLVYNDDNRLYNFSGDIAIIIGSDYINNYMNI